MKNREQNGSRLCVDGPVAHTHCPVVGLVNLLRYRQSVHACNGPNGDWSGAVMIHGIIRSDPVTDDPAWSRSGIAYLVVTWLLSAAVQVYVIVPASVVPRIATDFGVSQTTAVWLISAVLVAWAGTNFGVGVVVDRVGDYIVVAVSGAVVVGGALTGWVAAADGLFWPLIRTRVVAGVAVGAVWIASTTLVGRLFTCHRTRSFLYNAI